MIAKRFPHHYQRDALALRIDRELHHAAFDLFAFPDGRARENIDCLDAGFAALFEIHQRQVRADHRRYIRLIHAQVFASPECFAGLAVHGIERSFGPDKQDAQFRGLVKLYAAIQADRPPLWTGSLRRW
jgi:hypothetical protein